MAAEFPTIAELVAKHADSWHGEKRYPVQGITQPGFQSCTCGQWMDDDPAAQFSRASFGTHLQAEWVQARTIETPEQLDALPPESIIKTQGGSVACRFYDRVHGVVFGDDRPFKWSCLATELPGIVLWHPERDQ